MTAFEFYLSFYGLLLGLSVAQVASGIGHAVVIRRDGHMGWLTPLLSIFVLLDLSSFWVWAWTSRDQITVSYASVYIGLIIALAYYLAAVFLFPVRDADWADLDQHYWRNKRLVLLGVAVANAIVIGEAAIRQGAAPFTSTLSWSIQVFYWGSLLVMTFSKRKHLDGACLVILIAGYIVTTVFIRTAN